MRRRRHQLQVSTFPFLAVLLCAMGSLIFLLLVIDRQAKIVARNKVLAEWALRQDEEMRRARELQAERDEQQRQRLALLDAEKSELEQRLAALIARLAASSDELQQKETATNQLAQKIKQAESGVLLRAEELASERKELAHRLQLTEQARAELQRQAEELRRLETALVALRLLRQREQQTYSLVPYRGKHGDNRKPMYVECSGGVITFHPDRLALEGLDLTETRVRQEVVARMKEQKNKQPGKSPIEDRAYLLLLVRPDGVVNYYLFQSALKGLPIDFGYEYIDAGWILDFNEDGKQQPWQKAAVAQGVNEPSLPRAKPRSLPMGIGQGGGGGGDLSSNSKGGPTWVPGKGGNAAGSIFGGQGSPNSPGNGGTGQVGTTGAPGQGGTGKGIGSDPRGVGPGGLVLGPPSTSGGGPGQNGGGHGHPDALAKPGGKGDSPFPGNPGSGGLRLGPPNTPGGTPGNLVQGGPGIGKNPGEGGTHGGGTNAGDGRTPSGGTNGGKANPGDGGSSGGAASAQPNAGTPDQSGTPGDDVAKLANKPPNKDQPAAKSDDAPNPAARNNPDGAAGDRGPSGGGESGGDSIGFLRPSLLSKGPTKTATPPPIGRVLGNRDWIIAVECKDEEIVLRNTGQKFPLKTAADQQAVEARLAGLVSTMIARRQGTVRPGEPPYRPMIRLMVHPDGMRAYYIAYPLLQPLQLPMARENVEPESTPSFSR